MSSHVRRDVLVAVVGLVADEADLPVLRRHELAVAGVGLVVEDVEDVVVLPDPPSVPAARVTGGEDLLSLTRLKLAGAPKIAVIMSWRGCREIRRPGVDRGDGRGSGVCRGPAVDG